MSTPNPYPESPNAGGRRRKAGGPLLWILVLIALLAFGWYLYSRLGPGTAPAPAPGAVTSTRIGSEPEAAALRERARYGSRQAEPAASAEPSTQP